MENKKDIVIVGLGGIGKMYHKLLSEHYNVITVDPFDAAADYQDLSYLSGAEFDLAIICTPNHKHEPLTRYIIDYHIAKNILVEKPGFKTASDWTKEVEFAGSGNIKLFMVKNNLYRREFYSKIDSEIKLLLDKNNLHSIDINWLNKNRVPNPGSWFTNKELAFGGVSRDLMPHLLCMYYRLTKELSIPHTIIKAQHYNLESLESTDYGEINKQGIYNVDDQCLMVFNPSQGSLLDIPFVVRASWKDEIEKDNLSIKLWSRDGYSDKVIEFGLCPNECYLEMVNRILDPHSYNYRRQVMIDVWIHRVLEMENI